METTRNGMKKNDLTMQILRCLPEGVFAGAVVVDAQNIEESEIEEAVRGTSCRQVVKDVVLYRTVAAGLPFLTREAQLFYVPALMLAALDNGCDYYTECVLAWIERTIATPAADLRHASWCSLEGSTRTVILEFLKYGCRSFESPCKEECNDLVDRLKVH